MRGENISKNVLNKVTTRFAIPAIETHVYTKTCKRIKLNKTLKIHTHTHTLYRKRVHFSSFTHTLKSTCYAYNNDNNFTERLFLHNYKENISLEEN